MAHFKKHWSEDLQQEVLDCAEEIVRGLFDILESVLLRIPFTLVPRAIQRHTQIWPQTFSKEEQKSRHQKSSP
jgi:hypothetical protein